jgi:hypothetical protein
MGEREIALLHFDKLTSSDLVIYDRGYPSYDFVLQHITTGINCLIRVKKDFNNPVKEFVSSNKNSQVVLIYPKEKQSFLGKNYDKNTPIKVRLIRVELDNGEVEILMTTLLCSKKYPTKEFKKLYFLRWKIETFYDEIKNKLKVEFFSGYSEIVIRQDFNCAIFLSNLQSAFLHDLEPDIEQINQEKREKNQYEININTNLSYGFLRNRILLLLTKNQPTDVIIEELEKLFLAHTIPIRPNRSNPRNMDKYNRRKRPKVLKNQRDAI